MLVLNKNAYCYIVDRNNIERCRIGNIEVHLPNLYTMLLSSSDNKEELFNLFIQLKYKIREEIDSIYKAEKQASNFVLCSSSFVDVGKYLKTSVDSFYFTFEFINYINFFYKQYHSGIVFLEETVFYFINYFIYNYSYSIHRELRDNIFGEHDVCLLQQRTTCNLFYLETLFFNLDFILTHRLCSNNTTCLNVVEVEFMCFFYNFKFSFLSTLFIGNLNKNEKKNPPTYAYDRTLVIEDYLSLLHLSMEETLEEFFNIFAHDLRSLFIVFIKDKVIDENAEPLFLHVLYLYFTYLNRLAGFRYIIESTTYNNVFVDKKNGFFLNHSGVTTNTFKHVIEGICFLSKRTKMSDWYFICPFSTTFRLKESRHEAYSFNDIDEEPYKGIC